jgi:hypothetical protein
MRLNLLGLLGTFRRRFCYIERGWGYPSFLPGSRTAERHISPQFREPEVKYVPDLAWWRVPAVTFRGDKRVACGGRALVPAVYWEGRRLNFKELGDPARATLRLKHSQPAESEKSILRKQFIGP